MVQQELPLDRKPGTKLTQKDMILWYLDRATTPLAIHEMQVIGVSQNSIGSRLPELALAGKVRSTKAKDEPFKRWELIRGK